jgi:hypothetical protein
VEASTTESTNGRTPATDSQAMMSPKSTDLPRLDVHHRASMEGRREPRELHIVLVDDGAAVI